MPRRPRLANGADRDLVSMLRHRCEADPDRRIFTFLENGATEKESLTYAELDRAARGVAAELNTSEARRRTALLLYPAGLDFIRAYFGCLYAGVIPVPVPAPESRTIARTLPRLRAVLQDADPAVALTTGALVDIVREVIGQLPTHDGVQCLDPTAHAAELGDSWTPVDAPADALSHIQYTSGSTSAPKGVMVSHANVLHNLESLKRMWGVDASSTDVVWVPNFHDDGLVHGLLLPLYTGHRCYLMAPLAFLRQPRNWLAAISRYRANLSGGPNFAYEMCVRRIPPEKREGLDLSCWRTAYNGAEPVRPDTLRAFAEAFGPCGFDARAHNPSYGMAEATLLITARPVFGGARLLDIRRADFEEGRALPTSVSESPSEVQQAVSCGRAVPDTEIAIVDPETLKRVEPGHVGEIWVAGPGVALGFWKNDAATTEVFRAHIADTGEGPFLRTGDLGFMSDDEVFVTGRLKDLIIIRGRNLYPQDIEFTVEGAGSLFRRGSCIAFSYDSPDGERLVIALECRKLADDVTPDQLCDAIREAVAAEHDVVPSAIALLRSGQIPKSTSGKLARRRCRAKFLDGTLEPFHTWELPAQLDIGGSQTDIGSGTCDATSSAQPIHDDAAGVCDWLTDRFANALGVPRSAIDPRVPFTRFGIDSVTGVAIAEELERRFGVAVPATAAWDHPSIERLARFVAGGREGRAPVRTVRGTRSEEPIAIVGMAVRFPDAPDVGAFWRLLCDGGDAIHEVPASRWEVERYFNPDPATVGATYTKWGGWLDGVDRFDAAFFGIAPREAEAMDPQQRLLLETAWDALEDGGQVVDRIESRGGVFVGISLTDYARVSCAEVEQVTTYTATGTSPSVAAGRLAYVFGFDGPALVVDTACSSSLVAVHMARTSLLQGECDVALAGGASLLLTPHMEVAMAQMRALSPSGRCRAFDAAADGYVRSEGCGIFVLKRLSDALAAGDPIRAVIRSSAINQDGATNGLTAPSGAAQESLIRGAVSSAGLEPADIDYIEAHGTGTPLGDPIEVRALRAALGEGRKKNHPLLIGSVKTNLGHLEAAAGAAGLAKCVLALQHGTIPANLHFDELNPHIPVDGAPFVIPTEATPWPNGVGRVRRAGVSSFGFSGTNAHVIVESIPAPSVREEHGLRAEGSDAHADGRDSATATILPISARDERALQELLARYRDRLRNDDGDALADIAFTAAVRRSHHRHRVGCVGADRGTLADDLDAFLQGNAPANVIAGEPAPESADPRKVVFVYPGQGAQWVGMGRALLARNPAFRDAVRRCDEAIRSEAGWSLLDALTEEAPEARTDDIDVVQPMLFSLQVALTTMWRSFGIEPKAVVGHSMGEVAAAHAAGALDLGDAVRIICRRSKLLRRTRGKGAMGVVEMSIAELGAVLAGYEDRLSIAVSNSSRSTVLSGDPAALDAVIETLEGQDVFCRRINVDVASHSPQMDPLRDDLLAELGELNPRRGAVPMYSTVTTELIEGTRLDAEYWVRNLREPVMFSKVIGRLLESGHGGFVEVSPHPILVPALQQELRERGSDAMVLGSVRREEEWPAVMEAIAHLYARGFDLDWTRLFGGAGRHVATPSYPWQRERFWAPPARRRRSTGRRDRTGPASLLLGEPVRSSIHAGTRLFEIELDTDAFPMLAEHRVGNAIVVPAAFLAGLALEAATHSLDGLAELNAMVFETAVVLPEPGTRLVQLAVSPAGSGAVSIRVSSLDEAPEGAESRWTLHVRAMARAADLESEPLPALPEVPADGESGAEHYRDMSRRDLHYGRSFRAVERAWHDGEVIWGRLVLPDDPDRRSHEFSIQPGGLDSAFQLLSKIVERDGRLSGPAYVPDRIDRLRILRRPADGETLFVRVLGLPGGDGETVAGDLMIYDERGAVVAEVSGLRARRLARRSDAVGDSLYRLEWQEQARAAAEGFSDDVAPGDWLVLADRGGVADGLSEELSALAGAPVTVPPGEPYEELLDSPEHDWVGIVDLRGLDASGTEDAPMPAAVDACNDLVELVRATARSPRQPTPRLWIVTSAAQRPGSESDRHANLAQSPLWGLGRTIASEHPALRPVRVDLSGSPSRTELGALAREMYLDDGEDEIALRDDRRWVARLVRYVPGDEVTGSTRTPRRAERAGGRPFRVEVTRPGVLDYLTLREVTRPSPAPGEVLIAVGATGLNFMNVLSAFGMYPGHERGVGPLGIECAGTIAGVGDGVSEWSVGDEVMGLAFDCLGSHAVANAALVRRRPARLDVEEAAGLPVAFVTAYWALHRLARLRPSERILIHSAAGGVGQAAVQLARKARAEIFATASTPEKRQWLASQGVAHVMDSRSLRFAEQVMELTSGEGVDVVVNSLAGEAMSRSLEILRPYGRFIELGKRDIYENAQVGLAPFRDNRAYFTVDLDAIARQRPDVAGDVLDEVIGMLEEGSIEPIPHQTFPVSETVEAFRTMASGTHIGKIVVSVEQVDPPIEPMAQGLAFGSAEGTVMITGGLGGLGLTFARSLVDRGARCLVLVGRSSMRPEAAGVVSELRAAGAHVEIAAADVADPTQVARLFDEIDASMPPLVGIIHAAGLLRDAMITDLQKGQIAEVMAAKVAGAWHLHTRTADRPLEFFVLFSSASSLLGSAGQANYAAANAFLDALATERRARGLAGVSINWGPWSEVGLAAANASRGGRLAEQGLLSISPAQGKDALDLVLKSAPEQVAVMPIDWPRLIEAEPNLCNAARIRDLARAGAERAPAPRSLADDGEDLRRALLAADSERQWRGLILEHVRQQVGRIIRLDPARIDQRKPLKELGFDSLTSLELRNRLEATIGLSLPGTLAYNYPTLSALANHLADRAADHLGREAASIGASAQSTEVDEILEELEALTPEEARRLLSRDGVPEARE